MTFASSQSSLSLNRSLNMKYLIITLLFISCSEHKVIELEKTKKEEVKIPQLIVPIPQLISTKVNFDSPQITFNKTIKFTITGPNQTEIFTSSFDPKVEIHSSDSQVTIIGTKVESSITITPIYISPTEFYLDIQINSSEDRVIISPNNLNKKYLLKNDYILKLN